MRLLFSPPPSAALVHPTDEPSDREYDQEESEEHDCAYEQIGENKSDAVVGGHAAR